MLTIPAAGSEMSESSVITNEDGDVKLGYSNQMSRPRFAIMNPVRTFTLPPYQTAAGVTDMIMHTKTAAGVTDMIMHTMERYFSHDDDMDLTDAIAEALMRDLMDNVFKVLADPEDYRARAQIMWGGSLAHNDLTGCGLTGDWATHEIEHELSGMFDVTHGAGLAAIWAPGLHRSGRNGHQGHRGDGAVLPRHRHAHQHPRAHRQGSLGGRDQGNGTQVHPRA